MNKLTFIIIGITFLLVGKMSFSQTEFRQYDVNKIMMFYNPAYAGIKADLNFVGQYSNYWQNNNIAQFQVDGRLPLFTEKKNINLASGFVYKRDELGPFNINRFGLSAANAFELKKSHKLSVGIRYDLIEYKLDKNSLIPVEVLNQDDPAVNEVGEINRAGIIGLGVFFESAKKKLFGGISADYRTAFKGNNVRELNFGGRNNVLLVNGSVGAVLEVGEWIRFVPSVFIRTEFKTYTMQYGLKLFVKDWVYVGTAYTYNGQLTYMAGGRFGKQKIGFFELGLASYFYSRLPPDGVRINAYLNYFFKSKSNKEAINYN